MIPYGRQTIGHEDLVAVQQVLLGDWLTQGPTIEEFERRIADYVEAKHAIAFSSGTSALHGATAVSGLGPGDVVVTSPLSFMASANCARYVGARPALLDIDPATFNMNLSFLQPADALVAVHYAGLPVDLRALPYRPRVVIEDAAHALGAHTPSGPVGNCAHSDMVCFSFHPVKPITTAEGGMVTTNDDDLADRLRAFRSHGIRRDPSQGAWFYSVDTLGYNYRMTDLQAALGVSQVARLDSFIERRNEIATLYRDELKDLPIGLAPQAPTGFRHGYHLFPILVNNRREVFDGLRASQIAAQVHYVPIHHHPVSNDIAIAPGELANCDAVYEKIVSLPMYPSLSNEDQKWVISVLAELVS